MIAQKELQKRLSVIRSQMEQAGLDVMLVLDKTNSYYLSGFPCSNSIVIITQDEATFLTDFRYIESAQQKIKSLCVERMTQNGMGEFAALLKKYKPRTVGFEGSLAYSTLEQFKSAIRGAKLIEAGRVLSNARAIKSQNEIEIIAMNQKLNGQLFQRAARRVRKGQTEEQIRKEILIDMIEKGVEEGFESIIASGANSSSPHTHAGRTKVAEGEYLLFDMGLKRNHYHSDMTRTVVIGKPSAKHREIYNVVLEAQEAGLAAIRAGVACVDVDAAARKVISDAGYGEYFGHGLGHGVGLEIHEEPRLTLRSEQVLDVGMVVTVEPGIYLPGFGGVRIEDLVVVTKTGYRNLTSVPKKLKSLNL